jgi:hypothetical protein
MKFLKWVLIILVGLAVLGFVGLQVLQHQTKKASPEGMVTYNQGDLRIDIFYNRPSKKERTIFGGLVPYKQVWRTGANEATTFATSQPLTIGGKTLPAGKYTLWTIPGETEWTVIWNKKMYGWGVNFDSMAAREPAEDALEVKVPVQALPEVVEQFTISVQETPAPTLVLDWDRTRVAVPLK